MSSSREDICERLTKCLKPTVLKAFRNASANEDTTEQVLLDSLLGTWRTSLMGSDIERLTSLAADPELAAYVEVIIIADDSELVDPYASSQLPSEDLTYNIWPRCDAGNVDSSQLDVAALQSILLQKLIRPHTILIRDYRIEVANLKFCLEMTIVRDLLKQTGIKLSCQATVLTLA